MPVTRGGLTYEYDAPASDYAAVTKSDTTIIDGCRSLYVGGAGDVVLQTIAGVSVTFTGVPAGTILPVRCQKVMAATTATSIVALF